MAINDTLAKGAVIEETKLYIKRRLVSGNYFETNWQDITKYVADISSITNGIDERELNEFVQGGVSLILKNDDFRFSKENMSRSMFAGYLTRHKTKVKITQVITDINTGTEYSYDIASGLFDGLNMEQESDGMIYVPVMSPSMIFDDVMADSINEGLLESGTVDWYDAVPISTILGYIYNLEIDGVPQFTPYLEGSNISPKNDVTLDNYNFNTIDCRSILKELAEATQSCFYIGPDWIFNFVSRDATSDVKFTAYSQGTTINIMGSSGYSEGLRELVTRVQWYQSDPQIIAQESNKKRRTSNTNKYGAGYNNTYPIENRLVTSSVTRQSIVDGIFQEFGTPKESITLRIAHPCPHLKPLDRVHVEYPGIPKSTDLAKFDQAKFDIDRFPSFVGGIKIKKDFKVLNLTHNLKDGTTEMKLREV